MTELPEGWTIDVERKPNGINAYTLRRPMVGSVLPLVAVEGVTYPNGGAWIEHASLVQEYNDCGPYYSNEETMETADLRGRAVLFARMADDLAERDRTTSRDVLVCFPGSSEAYAFECDYRAAVNDIVEVRARKGGAVEVEVVELGTGEWDGPRKPAKFVRRGEAPEPNAGWPPQGDL
jgi:hypothetical protein